MAATIAATLAIVWLGQARPAAAEMPAPFGDLVLAPGETGLRADAEVYFPLLGDGSGFTYAMASFGTDEDGALVLGAGMGQRWRLADHFILGGHVLLDWYEATGTGGGDTDIWRATLGVEVRSENLTAHLNGYLTEGSVWDLAPLTATVVETDGSLQADVTGIRARALPGIEGIVGVRLPIGHMTGPDAEVWLRLGAHHFAAPEVDPVTGFSIGGTWRAYDLPFLGDFLGDGSRLSLGVDAYFGDNQPEDIRGLLSLTIPFHGDTAAPTTGLDRRFTDPVERRRALIVGTRQVRYTTGVSNSLTGMASGPVVYVAAGGDGDGSFGDPLDLAAGIVAAGPNGVVVVLDSGGGIDQQATLLPGQLLIGGGVTIDDHFTTSDGIFASFTPQGQVGTFLGGGGTGAAITAVDDTRLFGLSFDRAGTAIHVTGDGVTIERSDIRVAGGANDHAINAEGAADLRIVANTILGTGDGGTAIRLFETPGALVHANTITTDGDNHAGLFIRGDGVTVSDNNIAIEGTNSYGIFSGSSGLRITGNAISTRQLGGSAIGLSGSVMSPVENALIAGNMITAFGPTLAAIAIDEADGTLILDNLIRLEATGTGISLNDVDGSMVAGNTIAGSGNSGTGITVAGRDAGALNHVGGNVISDIRRGIAFGIGGGGITGNTIGGTEDAITASLSTGLDISGNAVASTSGAVLTVRNGAIVSGTGNSWDGTGGGVQCSSFDGTGSGTVSFDGLPDCSFP